MSRIVRRIGVIAAIVLVVGVFAGCGKKESVVGTWEGDDYTYTFDADGTGTQQIGGINVNISSYTAKDGKLSITVTYLGTEDTTEYTYTLKKDVLTLNNGDDTITLNKKWFLWTFISVSGMKVFFYNKNIFILYKGYTIW